MHLPPYVAPPNLTYASVTYMYTYSNNVTPEKDLRLISIVNISYPTMQENCKSCLFFSGILFFRYLNKCVANRRSVKILLFYILVVCPTVLNVVYAKVLSPFT